MPRLRRFDLVHIHNRPQWARQLRGMGYRGLLIIHLQNDHLGHWTAPMLNDLAADLDGLIVCSRYLEGQSSAKSESLAKKSRVIFNGVNTRLFFPSEKRRQPKTIFFVGSFIPEKGALQLVQAFERVLQQHPDASLVIGGSTSFGQHEETEYVRGVRNQATRLQEGRHAAIAFPGYIHHDDDLPAFFQRAALFTSPSLFQEPFGLVNAEAMACATPVVGSQRGGIPEVLGDTGRLIDPEDTAQYADALSELLSDSEGRWRMGRAAMERARTLFDWNVIARTWKGYLEDLTSGKPESPPEAHSTDIQKRSAG
jgi:glycosyltransferase involved in cell wall biosynthesis